ncbi:UvrD-helicase domain-containing protein [Actinocrispum wychmicini]|uniref:AAA domain-containing protein n=1 Tax=Actinocrispum wychmicini TaxID=1213861 RepID=A0A4R2J3K7_9PSEU|nr:UvrD-helicase domain-containing protein [Actinocrispum wychmicini]TCO53131.1 AAA domain-containing protein [Actinocrispum wychmicini]
MGLSNHSRRQVEKRAGEMIARSTSELRPLERRVLTALLARTAEGWHLFVRQRMGDPNAAVAFLIGPGGMFAVLIKDEPPDTPTARATLWQAEQRYSGVRGPGGRVLPESAVNLLVICAGDHRGAQPSELYLLLGESELPSFFGRRDQRLDRRATTLFANEAAKRLVEYERLQVPLPERTTDAVGLLAEGDLTADQVDAAQQRSFESWLTFLHPHQRAVVTRDYSGPARISGPAGTGKTVVALHRLRYLARRTTGPLLFTTFVRTLPTVHESSFHRLAPEFIDRVEFVNLHAWVRSFLGNRGHDVHVQQGKVDNAFSRAWLAHRDRLEPLEQHSYWRTEIDRVIKGRGIPSLDSYLRTLRRGRTLRLDGGVRTVVWQLYESYQRNLSEKNLCDFNDLISLALAELTEQPLDKPYEAVVVDEVQDITLVGLRLLKTLAGVGRNRLLLVGDGQQQVYPGGWRLSDADIPVQGRGEVLRVNYRNRAEVLRFAQRFDAKNQVDDLDGGSGVALRDVELANSGGKTLYWKGSPRDLSTALVTAVHNLPVPRGQSALIVFHHRDLAMCAKILNNAGIGTLHLDNYRGDTDDVLKIGTVHRAKGLDFQGVLVVQSDSDVTEETAGDQENRDLRGRQHLVAATRARDFLWWGRVVPDQS